MSFQEYPKLLRHPGEQPAIPSTIFRLGYKPQPGEVENPGRPAAFQPVTVNDANQEEYYRAKGYRPEGETSSELSEEASTPAHYRHNEYPKWVRLHDDEVLVNSAEEEYQLLGYNPAPEEPVKNKGGRPKGSKNKPISDHMSVTD